MKRRAQRLIAAEDGVADDPLMRRPAAELAIDSTSTFSTPPITPVALMASDTTFVAADDLCRRHTGKGA